MQGKYKQIICLLCGICFALVFTGSILRKRVVLVEQKTSEVQTGIANEVFRLHIPANSDSESDQEVKLKVRDAVIAYMKRRMSSERDDKGTFEADAEIDSANATKAWARQHLPELERVANQVLESEGYSYQAHAEVVKCYFPEKKYGDVTFPQGDYEALRIKLGRAKGHNWWCVLYPNLCFLDSTYAVVSEEGKEELKETLTGEEYRLLTAGESLKIKWFFLGD